MKHLVILEYVVERLDTLHALLRNGNRTAPEVREIYSQSGAIIYNFNAEKELRAKTARRTKRKAPRLKRRAGQFVAAAPLS